MQELLERVKEYRDSETSPLVISRLNSVCVDIVGMLEKEKALLIKTHGNKKVYDSQIQPAIVTGEEWYNETFNTKER